MPSGRNNRFAHNVSEVSADSEIPIQTGEAEGRARDEAPANSEESAKDPDEKSDYRQIDGADMGP